MLQPRSGYYSASGAAKVPDVDRELRDTTSTTPQLTRIHTLPQSITTRIMNSALHSSPPSTQITDTESPLDLKQCREYLERLGMSPAEADDLLPSNQRESCFVDMADFVDIVEELIATGGYGQMRHYDIKAIKIEWQNRNKELENQFEDLQNRILSDLLAYLSTKDLSTKKYEHAVKYAADFIQSDAYNYRISFIINVLPLLLNHPTPTPTQYPTAEDPRTIQTPGSSKKRAPKSKAQPSNVKLRRSARIRCLQEDSKKPTSPPPTRRQNKKGKQGKEGRQVRRRL